MTPDPRPTKRIVDATAGVEKIRAEGRCRACGLLGSPLRDGGILNRAHIISRGQRGDDVASNILPLCGSGTMGCHAAYDGQQPFATSPSLLKGTSTEEIRRIVADTLRDDEREYVLDKKGAWWLEKLCA